MAQNKKKNRILVVTSVVLSAGALQFSSLDYVDLQQSFGDEFVSAQVVQVNNEYKNTDVILENSLSNVSFFASFEKEKSVVAKMELANTNEETDKDLEETIRIELSDVNRAMSVVDFVVMNKSDSLLMLLIKMYLNLVSNRSEDVVTKMIEACFNSNNVSTNSFGIDLLFLHISFPTCRKFLMREFSHPFLKKKMNRLFSEALL